MIDAALRDLARAAGVAPSWKDVFGEVHEVAPPTLRAILRALGYLGDGDDAGRLRPGCLTCPDGLPPLVTARRGFPVELPAAPSRYCLTLEDGRTFDGIAEPHGTGSVIPAILEPGYHRLDMGGAHCVLAVAPQRCVTPNERMGGRGWGLAVQLYALRRDGDAGIGDFQALAALAPEIARAGAHAIAISPVHAQFSADPNRFSPYAPSSRTALNVLHAACPVPAPAIESLPFVDWPKATAWRLQQFRNEFETARSNSFEQQEFAAFLARQGERVRAHALFETLHAHFFGTDPARWHWHSWPAAFRDPSSPDTADFAREHAKEVEFHAWLQFRADRGLADAQQACRGAGMGIGLVSDLAVGTDSGGSQCWSRQSETLLGLTVGAPPDLLQRNGQNWGLTAFSPPGLVAHGFATFRDMLATALAHAGGTRIDHAMGLNRLWVIPEGASGAEGAYLSFPEQDLLRLIALESQRHQAVVLAEDLGTVPDGFQDRLREAGICGMRVLWFERDQAQDFVSPRRWTHLAAAMTSTHDLPTVAGWWSGRDLDWAERLGRSADPVAARAERQTERSRLWQTFADSGAAQGDVPDPANTAPVADAACRHVGASACDLVVLPVEDALGLVEQPNLPGTIDEHPNWQRRLPAPLFDDAARHRLAMLDQARRSGR